MRTTLTLDPDVVAQLEAERARTNSSLKQVVNDALRRGLAQRDPGTAAPDGPFTRPLHLRLRSVPDIADVSEAIARGEGDDHR
ncbi:MAG: ribbon-helix-helix protein, CopG family [Jiangellaceae bacterium]